MTATEAARLIRKARGHGMSVQEIAAKIGLSERGVYGLLNATETRRMHARTVRALLTLRGIVNNGRAAK